MGKVSTAAAVSLDGYIAGPNESGMEHLFAWFEGGDVEFQTADTSVTFHMTEPDARWLRDYNERIGVFVSGRRLFDLGDGWGGVHPMGKPVVIVTHAVPHDWIAAHPEAPFTFVTDGVAAAVDRARQMAGDRDVGVSSGQIASQCLELGLLDEISIDLVPVMLGGGVRFLEPLDAAPILLDGPTTIVQGKRVTHLRYTIRRGEPTRG
jgi:dihydrofolate reductase